MAVVSGRLKNSKSPKDLDDIAIALIDPNRIVDSVGAFTTIEYYGSFNDERAAFFNLLANHPAGRLRAKAAVAKDLTRDSVLALAADSSRDVKLALIQNESAVGLLSPEECLRIVDGDSALALDLLLSLEMLAKEDLAADMSGERAQRRDAVLRAVVDALSGQKDADVVRAVFGERLFLEEVEAGCASLTGRNAPREKPGSRSRERALNDATAIFGRPGDWAFAYAFVRMRPVAGDCARIGPAVFVPTTGLDDIGAELGEDPQREKLKTRLAQCRCARVCALAAGWACMPHEALESLKGDSEYAVRIALLQNDAALEALDEEDIVRLLAGDPGLAREAFWLRKPDGKVLSAMHQCFDGCGDPDMATLLADWDLSAAKTEDPLEDIIVDDLEEDDFEEVVLSPEEIRSKALAAWKKLG